MSEGVAAGRETPGWSMRARLTTLAAGVVAAAMLVGGPLWVWGVQYRMLEDLRERDRTRAIMEASHRVGRRGPVDSRRGARPGPPPGIDPFVDADLLLLRPGGDVDFTGSEEGPSAELVAWLESAREDPGLSAAATKTGELVAARAQALRDCLRAASPGDDPTARFPRRMGSEVPGRCRETVEAAHEEAAALVARLGWPHQVVSDPDRGRQLWTAVLVRFPDEEQPYAIAIDSSLGSVDASVQALSRSLVFGGPLLLALVAGVAWYLTGRSLRVVGDIQQELEEIAFGTLDHRLEEPQTKDEVGRLVDTLNRMLDRLAEGARRQREFIGDASHELRSPIASIRTQLEVALSHPDTTDWLRAASGANEEALRMQRLVDDLLRIARLDESRDKPPHPGREVDLDELVRSESADLQHAQVNLSGVSPVRVHGGEQDLRRVIRNLLENAERYGAGRIEVSLSRLGDQARLEIEDDGPGIPPEQRALVFDRFTRLDESRSRAGGGAGLGLSLARGLVQAHGGDIRVEEARLGGARLVVSLPVDPSTSPE